jgi:hypothetical protein
MRIPGSLVLLTEFEGMVSNGGGRHWLGRDDNWEITTMEKGGDARQYPPSLSDDNWVIVPFVFEKSRKEDFGPLWNGLECSE